MTAKSFMFWTGVGIATLAGSYLLIRWFIKNEEEQIAKQQRNEAKKSAEAPIREAGFHAIAKDHAIVTA
jgi:hypothetical protein